MRPGTIISRLPATIQRFARDTRGATVIEFALCSSAFMALLLGAAQIALIYFAQQSIQTSAEQMARQVMTGEIKQSSMTAEQFRRKACLTLPAYMTCSKLFADVRSGANWASLDTSNPNVTRDSNGNITGGLSYSTGGANGIVILRLFYAWNTVAGPYNLSVGNQTDGSRLLVGTMVFKSENYTA